MSMIEDILTDAAALIKAGKRAEAQKLLEPFIKANPQNVPAWLLEVETWPRAADKKKVLELCLRHNPGAPQVQQLLAEPGSPVSPIPASEQQSSPGAGPKPSAPRRGKTRLGRNTIILGCALLGVSVLLVLAYLATAGCNAPGSGPCTRVLFIGNSYTYVNDLPDMFARLARAGGQRVEVGMVAPGGWTLADHAGSSDTLDRIKSSKWDFVVLQEQSQIPSIEQFRTQEMYPAARSLVSQIEAAGAKPIFFLTWAHRDGWPENGLPDYESMQFQIDQGYLDIGKELGVPVAPAGYAWLVARRQDPQLVLWQDDGSHPAKPGTYLAACVFYATIFQKNPEGLNYLAGLPRETGRELQKIAADTALENP
jgi:hypothetical protein